jgi:hypothetical protein
VRLHDRQQKDARGPRRGRQKRHRQRRGRLSGAAT